MQLIQQINNYIETHNLLSPDSKVIAGVSGGADSMALLHILDKLNYRFIVAHCNFHLRGEESDRDEKFVKEYCLRHEFEFTSISFDTYAYMQEKSISLEMAARELRYNWFEECRITYEADKIAVAHHSDDSVETFMINLIRGTGIKGLTGISPSNGNIIRPMLETSRAEILSYIEKNNIPYITDSTNNESIYLRNKMRLEIIPLLEKINPSFKKTINRTGNYLSDVERIYSMQIEELKKEVFQNNRIQIENLIESGYAKTLLFEILHPLGFNPSVLEDVYESLEGIPGKQFYSDKYRLLKDREFFIIDKKNHIENEIYTIYEETLSIENPIQLRIKTIDKIEGFEIEKDKHKLYLDKSAIRFPLTIRRWEQGDRFFPFGMKGSKKLSDYFSDNKFSLIDKENVWLLCDDGDNILWIIGERADNRFHVTEKTKHIVKIELKRNIPQH